jgi:hypothetical protein
MRKNTLSLGATRPRRADHLADETVLRQGFGCDASILESLRQGLRYRGQLQPQTRRFPGRD